MVGGDWAAVWLSLKVASLATLTALPLAFVVAVALARGRFFGRGLLDALVHLPLVLPPVATGFALLLIFGRQGAIGSGLAKVGINGLTQQLSRELGGQNIRINAIAPGPIDTEANRTTTPQEMVADIVKNIPLSRMGQPEDLVGMCLFLLSDEAKWITGQIFNVDGGQIIRS